MRHLAAIAVAATLAACGADVTGSHSAPTAIPVAPPAATPPPAGLTPAPPVKPYAPVVFTGDSITYLQGATLPAGDVDAGVPSDTTAMMVARFPVAVLSYSASVVVILGGINDIRKQFGTTVPLDNVASMANDAAASGACVVIGLLLPVADHSWTDATPVLPVDGDAWVATYNAGLRTLAATYGYRVADYNAALSLADGTQDSTLFLADGLHPNPAGVARMWATVEPQLAACGVQQ